MRNPLFPRTKIDEREHLSQPLLVHELLSDYELEDVWRLPVALNSSQSLQLFMDQFKNATDTMSSKGMAGFLFKVRLALGRLFKWDEKKTQDHLIPGTIRFRYAEREHLKYDDLPAPGSGSFIPVYTLENEVLSEIENETVCGALHFSRIPSGPELWTIHMAVYVKTKGWPSKLYMRIITPFRLWIVYPAMMKAAKKKWERYLKSEA